MDGPSGDVLGDASLADTSLTDASSETGIDAAGGVEVLASGYPNGLALDDTSVYWADAYFGVRKCAKADCKHTVTILASAGAAGQLTIDAVNAYWVGNANVLECALTGCNDHPTQLASSAAGPIAVDATSLYWVTYDSIATCNKTACTPSPLVVLNMLDTWETSIAVDATQLYWSSDGGLMRCMKSVCSPSFMAVGHPGRGGVAVGPIDVVWSAGSNVYRCPTTGCSGEPQVVSNAAGFAYVPSAGALQADTMNAYWTAAASGYSLDWIVKCPVAGCATPSTMIEFQVSTGTIALDDTRMYWTDPQKGILASMPK